MMWFGYGSIPINTIFSGLFTSINPSYFEVHQGYRVLTHPHLWMLQRRLQPSQHSTTTDPGDPMIPGLTREHWPRTPGPWAGKSSNLGLHAFAGSISVYIIYVYIIYVYIIYVYIIYVYIIYVYIIYVYIIYVYIIYVYIDSFSLQVLDDIDGSWVGMVASNYWCWKETWWNMDWIPLIGIWIPTLLTCCWMESCLNAKQRCWSGFCGFVILYFLVWLPNRIIGRDDGSIRQGCHQGKEKSLDPASSTTLQGIL